MCTYVCECMCVCMHVCAHACVCGGIPQWARESDSSWMILTCLHINSVGLFPLSGLHFGYQQNDDDAYSFIYS